MNDLLVIKTNSMFLGEGHLLQEHGEFITVNDFLGFVEIVFEVGLTGFVDSVQLFIGEEATVPQA